jgi:predicted 3-demethylubiquinone-9 3-methyltransferase (glyoxalase superfamily)
MQKIVPCLWFDNNCNEAVNFYTSIFKNSKIESIQKYPENVETPSGPASEMKEKVLTAIFELEGFKFMALDGGPIFKFNPSISFSINCETAEEVDKLYEKLVDGGNVLMELGKYPFAEKYAWVNDKYGVSWQIISFKGDQKIIPALMFIGENSGKAEEAMKFYTSLFENSKIGDIWRYEKGEPDVEGNISHGEFTLNGQKFIAMDSSLDHKFSLNEAVSLYVECEDQKEVDRLWSKLSSVPESEQCGWLKDKYGISWQIIPKALGQMLGDPDKEKSGRVMEAMLKMKKIIIEDLEKAYNGK